MAEFNQYLFDEESDETYVEYSVEGSSIYTTVQVPLSDALIDQDKKFEVGEDQRVLLSVERALDEKSSDNYQNKEVYSNEDKLYTVKSQSLEASDPHSTGEQVSPENSSTDTQSDPLLSEWG